MLIVRSAIYHTPRNPFAQANTMEHFAGGALAIVNNKITACGDYSEIRRAHPDAPVRDLRAGFVLPGFIDTHIHFPQVRVLGGLGYSLLDWLEKLTLPEEARLADSAYASVIAAEFVTHMASHGTTTALVFGSHFEEATTHLFQEAARQGLRIFSGLVLADRRLLPELHQSPQAAWDASKRLIARFPGRYVVTPRFALSSSEAMLEVCQGLMKEVPSLRFTSHINENPREIEEVARSFPAARDYLAVYETFGLMGRRSVLAHNVHPSSDQLRRFAEADASVAHCPSSNAALGSGIFPMRRHLDARVRFALGTDVGGGTGFGVLNEALRAYLFQRVAASPLALSPAQLLYLATRAGAESLAIEDQTGDFTPGKAADFVYLEPPAGSPLGSVLKATDDPERRLAALITLAGAECVREVQVEGQVVFQAQAGHFPATSLL
jgi:guanine deaminase